MPFLNTFGAASAKSFGFSRKKGAVGQATYTTAGTYTFTVPAGATKMSVLTVDAGGAGGAGRNRAYRIFCPCYGGYITGTVNISGYGGGGGRTRYANCISVSAGQQYTVVVGCGSVACTSGGVGASCIRLSKVRISCACISFSTVANGGCGGAGQTLCEVCTAIGGGGGGAGGYTATGGYGQSGCGGAVGTSTCGFGGSGGLRGNNGGGVGIYGRRVSSTCAGAAGSRDGSGNYYGGGGGGGTSSPGSNFAGYSGVRGAVRILYTYAGGPTRQYPTTNVGDL